jgi:general secretion pathway protein A
MYESYYGFSEKPFSLTPDPKYLYRSESHANAFDLLQYAIRRREGFVVVTGDIGTGKTTLCHALLEQIDRTTFTALVLNTFVTEEDLLNKILQDFGVISREEAKSGRLAHVGKQALIDTLSDFLLSLIPLKASAVLIIDEAQNLPLPVLEQLRIRSNLETDKEKLLQIILVGQMNLQTQLRSPELRQLDQRVSIRYELKPLDAETVAAYVAHRLTIAGGSAAVRFEPKAIKEVHRRSRGIPRLINLICDRALLTAYSVRANRITRDMVAHAAVSLDVQDPQPRTIRWLRPRTSTVARAALVLLASSLAVVATTVVYRRVDAAVIADGRRPERPAVQERIRGLSSESIRGPAEEATAAARTVQTGDDPRASVTRRLPPDAAFTIIVGSYAIADPATAGEVAALTAWLEAFGFAVYYADVDLGSRGRWQRVLAGAYTDTESARRDADRLKAAAPQSDPRLVSAGFASGIVATVAHEPLAAWRRSGTEP